MQTEVSLFVVGNYIQRQDRLIFQLLFYSNFFVYFFSVCCWLLQCVSIIQHADIAQPIARVLCHREHLALSLREMSVCISFSLVCVRFIISPFTWAISFYSCVCLIIETQKREKVFSDFCIIIFIKKHLRSQHRDATSSPLNFTY